MIAEFVTCAVFGLAGYAFLNTLGFAGRACVLPGFLTGAMLSVGCGMVLVVSGLPTSPAWMLCTALFISFVPWAFRQGQKPGIRAVVAGLVLLGLAVFYFKQANLVAYHIDSFRYILPSVLLAENNYDMASINLLTKRILAVPLLHSPSRLAGEFYLPSVTPLLSICLLGSLWWFLQESTAEKTRGFYASGVLLVLLLLSNNRYVFNSFYINGHLFFAACFTVIAACGWLAAQSRDERFAGLMAAAVAPLIVTRAEGVLFAVLAMGPFVLSNAVNTKKRMLVLGLFGGSAVVWYGYVAAAYIDRGKDVPLSAAGPLLLGAVALVFVPVLLWPAISRFRRQILFGAEIFLWVILGVLAFVKPDILVESLAATWENVVLGAGSWGSSLIVLAGLVLFVLAFCRDRSLDYLRFPVTASVPLFFLLAYFRDGAYRVGNGDSLNRMLIQIIPLAVLFVADAAGSDKWGWISNKVRSVK